MTAISLFVLSNAVHLVTDGAYYDADGIVQIIGSKVMGSQDLLFAFALSGCGRPERLHRALEGRAPDFVTQEELIAALPAAMRDLRAAYAEESPWTEANNGNEFQVFVAMYSYAERRPIGLIGSTNQAYFGADYIPFTLVEVERLSSPPVRLPFVDPERDGLAIIEAQRLEGEEDGRHWVGGFAELTTVSATGIGLKRLVEWPDRLGERIAA